MKSEVYKCKVIATGDIEECFWIESVEDWQDYKKKLRKWAEEQSEKYSIYQPVCFRVDINGDRADLVGMDEDAWIIAHVTRSGWFYIADGEFKAMSADEFALVYEVVE